MIISPTKRRKKYGCLARLGTMYSVHVRTSVFSSSVYSYTVRDTRDSTFAVWLVLWGFFGNEYFPNGHARPGPGSPRYGTFPVGPHVISQRQCATTWLFVRKGGSHERELAVWWFFTSKQASFHIAKQAFIDACKRTVSGSLHDFIDSP